MEPEGTSRWTRIYAFSSVASSAASVTLREGEGKALHKDAGARRRPRRRRILMWLAYKRQTGNFCFNSFYFFFFF